MNYRSLHLLMKCNKEFSREKLRMRELSDTECMICSYIHSHDGCSQDEVSSALKTDKTTVGKALLSLERKNCVSRTRDGADRRVKRLTLTETGREKISSLVDLHNDWLKQIMTCLTEEEQAQFESYCDRLLTEAEKLTRMKGGKA